MQVSQHCYALLGFSYEPPWAVNAGFIAGDGRTLIVDSGPHPMAAATIHGYASAVRPANKLLLINTERHFDHIGGNSYLSGQSAKIYGHQLAPRTEAELAADLEEHDACVNNALRRARREGQIPFAGMQIVVANYRIDADTEIDLGSLNARVLLTPGHTPANLCVLVPDEGVVFCGDCVVSDYVPNLEGGSADDWRTWLHSLALIEALRLQVLVPGHGRVLRGGEIPAEINRVRSILENAIAVGVPPTLE
jgi:glyoxylase-like metal-dependent hydrolase (beta-lactamase superfamily II)